MIEILKDTLGFYLGCVVGAFISEIIIYNNFNLLRFMVKLAGITVASTIIVLVRYFKGRGKKS